MNLVMLQRLLIIAALLCFVLALVEYLGGSIGSSTGDEWLAGGFVASALVQAARP